MNIKKLFSSLSDWYYIGLFVVLVLIYLGSSFLVSPGQAVLKLYHLSPAGARAIIASFVIPLIITWAIGLYGTLKMKNYSYLIKDAPEAKGLQLISIGLLVLVLSQPLTSDLSSLIGQIAKHSPNTLPTLTIINNYIQIAFMGLSLTIVAVGASRLNRLVRKKGDGEIERLAWTLGVIVLSVAYCYLLVVHRIHTGVPRPYYMPDWLVLLTIAVPYLFFWYRGLYASLRIYNYQRQVKGLVYKKSLSFVAAGIVAVILSSIFVRFIVTVADKLTRLNITPLLIVVYVFLAITGLGYILIAWGARKLRRIEEV